jgi:hypothetical protein
VLIKKFLATVVQVFKQLSPGVIQQIKNSFPPVSPVGKGLSDLRSWEWRHQMEDDRDYTRLALEGSMGQISMCPPEIAFDDDTCQQLFDEFPDSSAT